MPKQFYPDVEPEQRKSMLEAEASRIEQTEYLRPLTAEEMDIRREKLTDIPQDRYVPRDTHEPIAI